MAALLNVRALLPCSACRALVPDRRQLTRLENATLETLFEREDVYPAYPSIASTARAGCALCDLMLRKLTAKSINGGDSKLVWSEWKRRIGKLDMTDDPQVRIRATFDFLPYATISQDGSALYGRDPSPEDGHQRSSGVNVHLYQASFRTSAFSGRRFLVRR